MNIGSVARVLVHKLGHFEVALRHVMGDVHGLPRRQRPVLQVLLPSSGFEDSRSIFWQMYGVYSVIDRIQCERRGRRCLTL